MNAATHLCPSCGEVDNASGRCWNCRTELVSPEPGFEYEFGGGTVEIVARDGVRLTDTDGQEYTIGSLAIAIEQTDAVVPGVGQ